MEGYRKYTKEQLQKIYDEEYMKGTTTDELAAKYHTDFTYQFKQHGIKVMPFGKFRSMNRERYYNTSIKWDFKDITNGDEAYILGFLYADGSTQVVSKQVCLKISKDDRQVLEEIGSYICTGYNLSEEKNKNSLQFHISSPAIYENIEKWNLRKKKEERTQSLPPIEKHLLRHFIRGYFDGDGTIYMDKNFLRCNICSTNIEWLQKIQELFIVEGIESKINIEKRKGRMMKCPQGMIMSKYDMGRLFIRRNHALEKLYHYLYQDAGIRLNRKYEKFHNWMKSKNLINDEH